MTWLLSCIVNALWMCSAEYKPSTNTNTQTWPDYWLLWMGSDKYKYKYRNMTCLLTAGSASLMPCGWVQQMHGLGSRWAPQGLGTQCRGRQMCRMWSILQDNVQYSFYFGKCETHCHKAKPKSVLSRSTSKASRYRWWWWYSIDTVVVA